ncbi:hypothetical protein, partial [Modestobacter sp. SSW1-42]|uniref:hypothetical protein n=1 Tax=Modestobacter sp. SSW1-42 TaxID=596372 RepID=UPI003985DE32
MFVYDLRHVLELPAGTPDQIVGLTELLKDVVRAGTAAAAVGGWVSALPCRRRRGRRRCPGRILIRRSEPPTPIVWECTFCGEEGSVDGWQDTSYDLRDRSPWSTDPEHDVSVSHDTATSLRELTLLDVDCERVIYGVMALAECPQGCSSKVPTRVRGQVSGRRVPVAVRRRVSVRAW